MQPRNRLFFIQTKGQNTHTQLLKIQINNNVLLSLFSRMNNRERRYNAPHQ